MRKIPVPVIVYVVLVLYTAAPIISVAIAGTIASINHCQLDEGNVHPCVIGGTDWGNTLYGMGVMGWFMLITIPTGGVALLIYTIGLIGAKIYAKRNKPK